MRKIFVKLTVAMATPLEANSSYIIRLAPKGLYELKLRDNALLSKFFVLRLKRVEQKYILILLVINILVFMYLPTV